MSFETAEQSIANARHARLYAIERSATVVWRYTSADRAIAWGGHIWAPLAISDDGVRMTGEASADELKISLPSSVPAAQLFRSTPPSLEVFVTLYDYDAGEDDALVAWVGSISAAIFTKPGAAELVCASLSASMRREGLKLKYERACPHTPYDPSCRVNKALYALPVRVTDLDAVNVTLARADGADHIATAVNAADRKIQVPTLLPNIVSYQGGTVAWGALKHTITATDDVEGWLTLDGATTGLSPSGLVHITRAFGAVSYYDYGAAEWQLAGATEMRGIETTSGASTLRLLGGTDGLGIGSSLTIYPGCDGTRAMCQDRFGNLLNHGGFPHMPGESIFGKRMW